MLSYDCNMRTMTASWLIVLCASLTVPSAAAQRYPIPAAAVDDNASLATAMPKLADALIGSYRAADRAVYLDELFRLQIVAHRYAAARATLAALRRLRRVSSAWEATSYAQYDIYAQAKMLAAQGEPFDEAFARSFRRVVGALDDRRSALVERRFVVRFGSVRDDVRAALNRQRGKADMSLADALRLVHDYQLVDMYEAFARRSSALIAADDARRYVVDNDRLITTADGARICALVVRPRGAARRFPTLLAFTIYGDREIDLSEARRTASNGYAAVEALTRGKGCSPDVPVPYEHDGADAATVIGWIARQHWSDGRVGMFGGSYNSFTQWAAAKHVPPALKALMPAVSNAPGIDTPMESNVFQSFSYDWPFYVTTGKWLDASTQGDRPHWLELQKKWYVSGASYRSMDRIDGRPNPIWDRWLRHPSYDAYWQRLIPYKRDFARIDIPVLTTDGYLAGQNVGGLYYHMQYHAYNPRAENYLVIGPYDHVRGQRGTVSSFGPEANVVAGYPIDAAAHIDIEDLRYRWFDYIFKGASRPAILRGRVNYEVMGANRWKHAASVDAMHDRMLRFHLTARRIGNAYRLAEKSPNRDAGVGQVVDLADRSDMTRVPPAGLDTYLGVAFESSPFKKPFDLTGLFAGRLEFVTNKRDFDFNVSLYEQTPRGAYVAVTYFMARASYVEDRSHRRLLTPGKRMRLDFTANRLASWRFPAGSRLVVVLSVVKDPGIQINYGTGKDVSDETIADAKVPLRITWFARSFVDIPTSNTTH